MSNISAFPTYHGGYTKCDSDGGGMTLRDYFAAKAMQGMLAACSGWSEGQQERLAKCSYAMADEMIKVREQA